jgi:hypothetical protein
MNSRFSWAKLPLALTRVRFSHLPINIYRLKIKNEQTGQTVTTEIDSGDTLFILKKQIERSFGIPIQKQKLGNPFTQEHSDKTVLDTRYELGKKLAQLYEANDALTVKSLLN